MNRKNKDRSQISDSSFAQIKPHIFSIIKKKKNHQTTKKFFQVTLSIIFWFYILDIKTAPNLKFFKRWKNKWKQPVWKVQTVWFQLHNILEKTIVKSKKDSSKKDRKRSMVFSTLEAGGRDESVKHRGSSGQWNYSVWYYNNRHITLHICQKPYHCTAQRRTII